MLCLDDLIDSTKASSLLGVAGRFVMAESSPSANPFQSAFLRLKHCLKGMVQGETTALILRSIGRSCVGGGQAQASHIDWRW